MVGLECLVRGEHDGNGHHQLRLGRYPALTELVTGKTTQAENPEDIR
jgi:hypothetical protein